MLTGPDIAAARRAAGLTQQQLADALGVSPITVMRWETGRRQQRSLSVDRDLRRILGIARDD